MLVIGGLVCQYWIIKLCFLCFIFLQAFSFSSKVEVEEQAVIPTVTTLAIAIDENRDDSTIEIESPKVGDDLKPADMMLQKKSLSNTKLVPLQTK